MAGVRSVAALGLDRSWDVLLICVAVYFATAVGRTHQLFPFLIPLRVTLISAALALGLYVVSQDGPRDVGRLWCGTAIALAAFVGWASLSIPGALNDGLAFHLVVDPLTRSTVVGLLAAGAVRGMRDVERLVSVYFVAAALFAAVMLVELGGTLAVAGATLKDAWPDRFYYDANDFATYAVSALPFGIYFVLTRRPLLHRLMSLAGVGALSLALVWSGSRGGLVALLVAGTAAIFVCRAIPWRVRFGAPAAIALVVIAVAGPHYWKSVAAMWQTTDYNYTSETGRLAVWKRGLSYAFQRPLFGLGAGNFPVAEGTISTLADQRRYGRGVKWSAAHNSLLQVAAEVGIPGLVLYIAVLVSAFGMLRRIALQPAPRGPPLPRGSPNAALIAQALLVSLVGFFTGALFLSLAYAPMLYAMLGLAIGLRKVVAWEAAAR